MRSLAALVVLLLCAPRGQTGDDVTTRRQFAEISALIQRAVSARLPAEGVETRQSWGDTVPVPPKLPLPALRKYIRVGDHFELPHGAWRRFKGRIEDRDKELQVQVREFRALDASTYRLACDVDVKVACEGEWQQWQKGLLLVAATANADADLRVSVVCDVGIAVDFNMFPPSVKIDPKVQDLHVDLKSLTVRQLGNRLVQGEKVKGLPEGIEDVLRDVLKSSEPLLKAYANDAIARGLREGKGDVSPSALLKAAQGLPAKK
jgi:hypothetical protein